MDPDSGGITMAYRSRPGCSQPSSSRHRETDQRVSAGCMRKNNVVESEFATDAKRLGLRQHRLCFAHLLARDEEQRVRCLRLLDGIRFGLRAQHGVVIHAALYHDAVADDLFKHILQTTGSAHRSSEVRNEPTLNQRGVQQLSRQTETAGTGNSKSTSSTSSSSCTFSEVKLGPNTSLAEWPGGMSSASIVRDSNGASVFAFSFSIPRGMRSARASALKACNSQARRRHSRGAALCAAAGRAACGPCLFAHSRSRQISNPELRHPRVASAPSARGCELKRQREFVLEPCECGCETALRAP